MKKFILPAVITFTLIFFIEVISGKYFFGSGINCVYLNCNVNYLKKVNFIEEGSEKTISYSRDRFGFRGIRKTYDQIDFLVVGGSTTDEKFMDLNDTWIERLEKKFVKDNFDVDIVNAGIDGQSSLGHIYNFENWFFEIKNLKPKFIVFYLGLNEGRSDSYLRFDNHNTTNFFQRIKFIIKKNNGLFIKYYRKIKLKYLIKNINNGNRFVYHNPGIDKKYEIKKYQEASKINKDFYYWVNDTFEKRLYKLMNFANRMEAVPIFISQKSLRWIKKDEILYEIKDNNIKKNELVDSYFYKENIISEKIENFSKENNLEFINGFKIFEFNNSLLYDYTHTNIEGSKYIAETLYPKFKKIFLNNYNK